RSKEVRAMDASYFECAHGTRRAGDHPNFPVRANAVSLAMRTDSAVAAVCDDVRQALRLHAEMIVGQRAHPAPAKMWHELAPGSPALELGIFPDVADLLEIFFVPGSGAANRESRRVHGVGLAEEFGDVAIERGVRCGVLESRLAVHQHADFVEQVARAFPRHAKTFLSRDFRDPLALFAVWLEVLLQSNN